MWYTYDQWVYMDCIYIYTSLRAWVSLSCDCVLAEIIVIRRVLFSLKWDKQQVLLGGTRYKSWHESTSIIKSISLDCHLSHNNVIHTHVHDFKFFIFVPIPLPPCCIRWCQHIHHASSDASPIYFSRYLSFSLRQCLKPWLCYQSNRIFKPFLHQFFTLNVNWPGLTKSYVKSMTSVTTRMTIICRKPHCTLYKSDNVYVQSLPTSSWGLPSRWSNWRGLSAITFARPTISRSWT